MSCLCKPPSDRPDVGEREEGIAGGGLRILRGSVSKFSVRFLSPLPPLADVITVISSCELPSGYLYLVSRLSVSRDGRLRAQQYLG